MLHAFKGKIDISGFCPVTDGFRVCVVKVEASGDQIDFPRGWWSVI